MSQPGGWYFEFNNEFYPDVDDSAQVLLALNCVSHPRERNQIDVSQRALELDLRDAVQERWLGEF